MTRTSANHMHNHDNVVVFTARQRCLVWCTLRNAYLKMPACQAINCSNKQGECKKSFFVIPNPARDDTSKQRCKQWLTNLRNRKLRFENYVFNARKLVCEDHFTPDCFDRNHVAESLNFLPRCKKLKPDAVPTLIDTTTNKMKAKGSVKNVRVKPSNNKLQLKKDRTKVMILHCQRFL